MVSSDNRRIAKNTIVLYLRTLFIMAITLYTGRVILDVLGVSDYGVYNVIAGVTGLIGFVRSALGSAVQRYINVAMGNGSQDEMKKIFSMSLYCYCLIALISLVLAESIGLWFVLNKLNIPEGRMDAAVFMYHCTVIMFVLGMLTVPFHSVIIAHERMDIYAFFSIFDAVIKLVNIYIITIIPFDKLKLYAILLTAASLLQMGMYVLYCHHQFTECRLARVWDKNLIKGIYSFSSWMLVGTTTNVLSTQGINMLINIFFTPVFNAARGVAIQVYGAVNILAGNFMTAVQPQIVQSHARNDVDHSLKLVFSSSKLSAFLMFIIALPIMLNADYILDLWLVKVPPFTALFVNLVIIDAIITTSYNPIFNIAQAANKVRNYEIVVSVGFVLIFIITLTAFRNGAPVYWAFLSAIIINIIGLFVRLLVLKHDVQFPMFSFCRNVISPIATTTISAWGLSWGIAHLLNPNNFILVCVHGISCMIITLICVWLVGTNMSEKQLITQFAQDAIKKMTPSKK